MSIDVHRRSGEHSVELKRGLDSNLQPSLRVEKHHIRTGPKVIGVACSETRAHGRADLLPSTIRIRSVSFCPQVVRSVEVFHEQSLPGEVERLRSSAGHQLNVVLERRDSAAPLWLSYLH